MPTLQVKANGINPILTLVTVEGVMSSVATTHPTELGATHLHVQTMVPNPKNKENQETAATDHVAMAKETDTPSLHHTALAHALITKPLLMVCRNQVRQDAREKTKVDAYAAPLEDLTTMRGIRILRLSALPLECDA
jgi:hypothetical protein